MAAANTLPTVPHPARPGCILTPKQGDAPINFRCDGCMEPGEVHLHTHCALATSTLHHRLVNGTLELRHEAPAGGGVCSACYGTLHGFHYYCSKRNSKGEYPKLHPACAKLPMSMTMQSGDKFELHTEVSHLCTSCMVMEWYYRPWCYRSINNPDQRMYLHINCIKEIMAGFGSRGGGGGGNNDHHAGDDEERMMVRLRERAGRNVRLDRRVCKMLVILVRCVVRLLIGDPTPIFIGGVNAIASMSSPN